MVTPKTKRVKRPRKPVAPEEEQKKKIIYLLDIIAIKLGDILDRLTFLCDDVKRNQ